MNEKIRGMDACSNEIYCRPEVFPQAFRYLLDFEFTYGRNICASKEKYERKGRLHATYHAERIFWILQTACGQ